MKKIGRWLLIVFAISLAPLLFFSTLSLVNDTGRQMQGVSLSTEIFIKWLVGFLASAAIYSLAKRFADYLHSIWPWLERKYFTRRVIVETLGMIVISGFAMFAISMLAWKLDESLHWCDFNQYLFTNIATAIVITLIVAAIWEAGFFMKGWKASIVRAERLEKENLLTKYQSLKSQVDPHFLFNSLNVLSSLVHSDAQKAENFIDEFARVYRYVLDISDKSMVELGEELSFLESFIYLQRIRFEEGLLIEIDIPEKYRERYVPTLVLQELITNAIKHNSSSKEQPLRIELFVADDRLHVRNNLQPRSEAAKGTGKGLENLQSRYAFFSDSNPVFEVRDGHFVAVLPIIEVEE